MFYWLLYIPLGTRYPAELKVQSFILTYFLPILNPYRDKVIINSEFTISTKLLSRFKPFSI